jgi:hypothetical protein
MTYLLGLPSNSHLPDLSLPSTSGWLQGILLMIRISSAGSKRLCRSWLCMLEFEFGSTFEGYFNLLVFYVSLMTKCNKCSLQDRK